MNCTLVTPTLSEAVAVRFTVLDTVAPAVGAVRLTVGGVVSRPEVRADCWVCGVAVFTSAKVVVDVVVVAAVIGVAANVCPAAVGSTLWLVSVGSSATLDTCLVTSGPNWRRATAATAHAIGESTGARGLSVPNGSRPADANPANTTLPTAGPGGVGSSGAAEITSAALTSADDTAEMRVGNAVPGGGAAGRSTAAAPSARRGGRNGAAPAVAVTVLASTR